MGGKRILDVTLREKNTGAVSQILCFRDMTHEVEVERLKTEFLTAAAHELRTPMTTIYGYSEMLLHRSLDEETRLDLATEVHQQAKWMVSILNDMLDLARIEERRDRDMQWQAVSLNTLVTALVQGFKPPAGRDAPVIDMPEGPLVVWGDEAKVKQAVFNVLTNAYKYSPSGGPVTVELLELAACDDAGAMAGVRIIDRGIGMTPEQLARVFERFYRADASGRHLGTGLGMSLVKDIVDLHRGRVELQSQPGEGTTVTLWFPTHREL